MVKKKKCYIVVTQEKNGKFELTKNPLTHSDALKLAKRQRKSLPSAKTTIRHLKSFSIKC